MANAKTTEVKLLSIPIFDLEKKLLDLYTKFGDDTLVAEDTINYVKSMDEESKSKLMLLVAYEMQELDKGMTVFRQFLELFDSEFTDETNLAYSQLAKSIAIQTAIPNDYDDLMKKAIDAGSIEANVELGVCYANGDGVEQNYTIYMFHTTQWMPQPGGSIRSTSRTQ